MPASRNKCHANAKLLDTNRYAKLGFKVGDDRERPHRGTRDKHGVAWRGGRDFAHRSRHRRLADPADDEVALLDEGTNGDDLEPTVFEVRDDRFGDQKRVRRDHADPTNVQRVQSRYRCRYWIRRRRARVCDLQGLGNALPRRSGWTR